MKYYIGSTNGSGITVETWDDFVKYLEDKKKRAEAQGDECFDVFVENFITSEDEEK